MAIEWVERALKAGPMSQTEKLVLLILAFHANRADGGHTWPSRELIAAESSMSLRTVQRALLGLQSGGWITVRGNGRGHRSEFWLSEWVTNWHALAEGKGANLSNKGCQFVVSPTPPIRKNRKRTGRDGTPREFAKQIFKSLGIVADRGTIQIAAQVIEAESGARGSLEVAAECLRSAMLKAKEQGQEKPWRFWLLDGRYRAKPDRLAAMFSRQNAESVRKAAGGAR